MSDANYYATEAYRMDPPLPGLGSSARALLRAADAFWQELSEEAHQETMDRLDAAELRGGHHG